MTMSLGKLDGGVVEAISSATGLSKEVMDDVWEQVKKNQALLKACGGHDFSIVHEQRGLLRTKWRCSKCGGVVDLHSKHWYELGLAHAVNRA
jgi:hypothetical protein